MGAQRASWLVAFWAAAAVQDRLNLAQSLLDLVKAFDKIRHHHMRQASFGYSFTRLSTTLIVSGLSLTFDDATLEAWMMRQVGL